MTPAYEPTAVLRFVQRADKRILQQVWVPWGRDAEGKRTQLPGFIWRDVSLMTEDDEPVAQLEEDHAQG